MSTRWKIYTAGVVLLSISGFFGQGLAMAFFVLGAGAVFGVFCTTLAEDRDNDRRK